MEGSILWPAERATCSKHFALEDKEKGSVLQPWSSPQIQKQVQVGIVSLASCCGLLDSRLERRSSPPQKE